jgi:hypothetical protein
MDACVCMACALSDSAHTACLQAVAACPCRMRGKQEPCATHCCPHATTHSSGARPMHHGAPGAYSTRHALSANATCKAKAVCTDTGRTQVRHKRVSAGVCGRVAAFGQPQPKPQPQPQPHHCVMASHQLSPPLAVAAPHPPQPVLFAQQPHAQRLAPVAHQLSHQRHGSCVAGLCCQRCRAHGTRNHCFL